MEGRSAVIVVDGKVERVSEKGKKI